MNNLNLNLITFFGIGKIKFGQISFATVITCLIFYFTVNFYNQSFWILLFIFFIVLIYSPYAIVNSIEYFDNNNPREIVINKVLGISIPLLCLSATFQLPNLPESVQKTLSIMWFLDEHSSITKFHATIYYKYLIIVNFLLFRFFCIFKPFQISYVDKRKIFFGIIMNDLLAGLYCVFFPFMIIFFKIFLSFVQF